VLNTLGGIRKLVPPGKLIVDKGFAALCASNRITITGQRYFHIALYPTTR
jgi:hypothetical protein